MKHLTAAASAKPELREFALRALADKKNDKAVPAQPFVGRTERPEPARAAGGGVGPGAGSGIRRRSTKLFPLTADADFLVSHVATNCLVTLQADGCVPCKAVEPSTSPKLVTGALHVLKQIHDVTVVDGTDRAGAEAGGSDAAQPGLRRDLAGSVIARRIGMVSVVGNSARYVRALTSRTRTGRGPRR